MIERWEFVHFPCDKDPLRYKLKIKANEEDIPALIKKLGVSCGRPFTSLSKDFNWAFYLYQVEKKERNHIIEILKETSCEGTVHGATLEMSQELPPILEEFLNDTARSLLDEEEAEKIVHDQEQQVPEEPVSLPPQEPHEQSPQSSLKPEQIPPPASPSVPPAIGEKQETVGMKLNIRYTFEKFIVGPNNRFTHAASQAVAENLGKIYNPLFIYGGVGLGKTHLMQAVAHYVKKKNPQVSVLYMSTEKFMGEVIEAIGKGSMQEFRDRLRGVNLLLIDDIQFLAESEATQEEFFHTFNHLHENGQQIIITSDRPPKQLVTLEDRLRSRFEWGLIADIKSPALETRIAILKRKSMDDKLVLDENMLLYIATKLKSNIRELEGFLKRINAYAELTGQVVDIELVKTIMKELLPEEEPGESPPSVQVSPESPSLQNPPINPSALKPVTIGFSVTPVKPMEQQDRLKPPVMRPPVTAGPSLKNFGEDVDSSLTPIDVGFFYPENCADEFAKMKDKFKMIIKKHKLKFRLEPIFEAPFSCAGKINYVHFTEQCKAHDTRIVIILGPPPDTGINEDDFANLITAVMEDDRIALQLIPWRERDKDYRYLNLALDITLLRHRKATG